VKRDRIRVCPDRDHVSGNAGSIADGYEFHSGLLGASERVS
jgi:hypothetical protein